jgi:Fatty acid/phospholipid biosynthesis enzyme
LCRSTFKLRPGKLPRVAVDALGGDKAPDEVILGALDAAADGIEIVLYGPAGLDTGGSPWSRRPR